MNKLATNISGIYLIVVLLMIGLALFGEADALSGVALVVITLPWSFVLGLALEAFGLDANVGNDSAIFTGILFSVLSILNVGFLYSGGVLLSRVWRRYTKKIP